MDGRTIEDLPDELIRKILRDLEPVDWVALARSSRRLWDVVADPLLWQNVAINMVRAPWHQEVWQWAAENLQIHIWIDFFFANREEKKWRKDNPHMTLYPK